VPIEARRFDSIDGFLDLCGPFLEAREPEHHLTLGILGGMERHGPPPGAALVAATTDGRVVATGVWSPSWNVVLSEVDDDRAIPALVEVLAGEPLPGVHAPSEHAEAFARAWTTRNCGSYALGMRQRSYALETVEAPANVPGTLRQAGPADRDRLHTWLTAFDTEAMDGEAGARISGMVEELVGSEHRVGYIWEDGEPVSMCQATGATPHGIRIGAVYTPPEVRRRGYASALVAAASQAELDRGRRWCFLFTDLANTTSNRIYQAIGYRPVRDVLMYRFQRD
jgi:uncharacterized protein